MFEAQYNKHKSTQMHVLNTQCKSWILKTYKQEIMKFLFSFFLYWLSSEIISFDILGWIKCY